MIKLQTLTLLLLFCLGQIHIKAQDVRLYSQADVDAFNQTVVNGDLIIASFSSDIDNLNGLSSLERVEGSLKFTGIQLALRLQDLSGLESLTYIGDDLDMESLRFMEDLSGLSSLSHVGGNIHIVTTSSMRDLQGLESLDLNTFDTMTLYI